MGEITATYTQLFQNYPMSFPPCNYAKCSVSVSVQYIDSW